MGNLKIMIHFRNVLIALQNLKNKTYCLQWPKHICCSIRKHNKNCLNELKNSIKTEKREKIMPEKD